MFNKFKVSVALLFLLLVPATILPAFNWNETFNNLHFRHIVELRLGESGRCTGVIVRPDIILTAAHCTAPDEQIIAIDQFGRKTDTNLLGKSVQMDLALLSSHIPQKTSIKFANRIEKGEEVMAMGFNANSPSLTVAHVMGLDTYVKLDRPLQFGYSGGPTVNTKGELVGINDMTNFRFGIGMSIPISTVRVFLMMYDFKLLTLFEEN